MTSETKWTNEEVMLFLSVAFRHVDIVGNLELDDVRLGVQFVNDKRAALASARGEG